MCAYLLLVNYLTTGPFIIGTQFNLHTQMQAVNTVRVNPTFICYPGFNYEATLKTMECVYTYLYT